MRNKKIYDAGMRALINRIKHDIVCLRENSGFNIAEDYETDLLGDLRMFLLEDIAREIRISVYNPEESNKVYLEFRYKPDISGDISPPEPGLSDEKALPAACLFDIFLYFSPWFAKLDDPGRRELLKNCAVDWFNLDIDLSYKNGKSENTRNRKIAPSVSSPPDPFHAGLLKGMADGQKLFFILYKDLERATETISSVLKKRGKVPVNWSVSRGFYRSYDINDSEIEEINRLYSTKDPGSALNFVTENEENQVSWLFEDFHHHLGRDSTTGQHTAEIRSRIRDLSRALRGRDEAVFFLSPSDSLPVELVPLFFPLRQGSCSSGVLLLTRYGYDMTEESRTKGHKPLVARELKKRRVIQTLCQMETNNPVLVGEPGVGKTAIVEALAQDLASGAVPSMLKGYRIFSLNLGTLVAGSKYRGDFEERIVGILEEVKSHNGKLIVFIDEIHTLLGTGSTDGSPGVEDVLKPALARGDFPCIGATTYDGYRVLEQDAALARRFKKIEVAPASDDESRDILFGIKSVFEKHHGVTIREDAINTAIRLSNQYMADQFLPGKAIRLLDSASALVKLEGRDIILGRDVEEEIAQCAAV